VIYSLETKRQVLAQIFVCNGCCCGRTEKGHPEVPLEWLKAEFKARKLIRNVQLSISGCLGPCDLSNVVSVLTVDGGMMWFGNLTEHWQYESLMDWASAVKDAQRVLDLPEWMEAHRMDPMAIHRSLPAAV
jgi:cobaltochelatase CobN